MKSPQLFLIAIIAIVFSISACTQAQPVSLNSIIPKPVSVKEDGGQFELTTRTAIYFDKADAQLEQVARIFALQLEQYHNLTLPVTNKKPGKNCITLSIGKNDSELGKEGYELNISKNEIALSANDIAGVYMGTQTIHQLILASSDKNKISLTTGVSRDYPTYPFRGSMLDVARHFFSVTDIKRYIDLISLYKMNVFHIHLSDDQGWRIEIKSWPKLTETGSKSEVGTGPGGYYTQEQFKEIVQYATERFVTVIPEVDFPGHTNAALASYPELNCNDKAPAIYTGTEVGFSTLCASKEITFKFIDDVVKELAALTPGPYIHLGGDESLATKKEDYITFANRMQEIVESHGKKMIGWEEISQGKLQKNTVIQYWSKAEHAVEGVKQGAMIIMSPATKVYLDMKYDKTTKLGQDWAARIEIDSSYNWKVSKKAKGIKKENILGVEAPLWTETITNMDEIEYMIFPRLPGIAELAWSPEESLSWDEYKIRLGKHAAAMKKLGIDFYESKQINWSK